MPDFVAVVVALALAAILWRIVRWMTKHSNASTKDVQLSADKEVAINKLQLSCDKKSAETLSTQSSIIFRCTSKNADLMQFSPTEPIGEKNHLKDETSTDNLQLELCQERELRERAEDWADFLARELEAHIRARIEAERRCHRLQRGLNSTSPKILTGNDNKPASRNFKDIDEAHKTWLKTYNLQNKQDQECLTLEPEHDEDEWLRIVDANRRFLQATKANNKQKDLRTTNSNEAEEDGSMEDLSAKTINIVVEDCANPGQEEKILERRAAEVEISNNKSYEDFIKLRLPSGDQQNLKVPKVISNSNHETNQPDKAEIDTNPLVCTDSLSNIKKATEKWENIHASKEILGSTEDLSPSSADKNELQDSCIITPGLVKKNLKMYETSETVDNVENQ